MAEEYTWAQIHGQVDAVMQQYRGMAGLQAMLAQAAQVEAYLVEHGATATRMEEALDAQRVQLIETSQAYSELQEAIAADKKQHQADMRLWNKNAKLRQKACHEAVEEAELKSQSELARIEASTDEELRVITDKRNEAYTELREVERAVRAARAAMASLKESL